MLKCEKCCSEYVYRLKQDGQAWVCDRCYSAPISVNIGLQEKVRLGDYGLVSKRRIQELERRVILNYNPKTGSYDVGRRGENGRIQEREPDYRR